MEDNMMKSLMIILLIAATACFQNGWAQGQDLSCTGLSSVAVCDDFTTGSHSGTQPQHPGQFTSEGWVVNTNQCQIKYDLGELKTHGIVEFYIKGPLDVDWKQIVFAAWNEEAATDGNRTTQSFFQLRFQEHGMMLRLTNRSGGGSFEGLTGTLSWDANRWYHIKGEWDTRGGTCSLWRDGQLLKTGKFNASFSGLRWCFIGKDNYKSTYVSLPGVTYKNLKIYGVVPGATAIQVTLPRKSPAGITITPNPFYSEVCIRTGGFNLPQMVLGIYSLDGRLIKDLSSAGARAVWRPLGRSAGVYIVRMETGTEVLTRPITLMK
jgi:hypothetical protein